MVRPVPSNMSDQDRATIRENRRFPLFYLPAGGDHLPESWRVLYKAVEPGTVRGGIVGQAYDERCKAFEREQAAADAAYRESEEVPGF